MKNMTTHNHGYIHDSRVTDLIRKDKTIIDVIRMKVKQVEYSFQWLVYAGSGRGSLLL